MNLKDRDDKQKAVLTLEVKAPDEGESLPEGVLRFRASTAAPDRENDTINQAGWVFQDGGIPFLWAHSHHIPPLGKIISRTIEDGQLILDVEFDLDDEFASKVYRKYRDEFMDAVSVGFRALEAEPNEHGGLHFERQELMELSAVPVGAHQDARLIEMAAQIKAKAINVQKEGRILSADNYRKLRQVVDAVQEELGVLEGILERATDPDAGEDEEDGEGEDEESEEDAAEPEDDEDKALKDAYFTLRKETEDHESFLTIVSD